MGLLLFRTHLRGENNSRQSAFHIDAISFPGFSRTLPYGEKETTLGTRLTPIKTSLNNCRRVFQDSGLQHRDFENGEGSGVKSPHVECVEQKMSLMNFQI